MDAILSRHSVRSYATKEIPEKILSDLVHAGMSAPSAMHSSPWHFIVVTDKSRLSGVAKIHPYAQMSTQAAAGILVCGEPGKEFYKDFFDQNCAAAAENILIAATANGIGSVWVGLHPNKTHIDNFRKYFNVPDEVVPFAWIPLGYPNSEMRPDNRFDQSKVHNNIW